MYEMENRNTSQRVDHALSGQHQKSFVGLSKTINVNAKSGGMAEKIQLAQQVVLEKNEKDNSKLAAMIEEIDMIREDFHERKRSLSK